VSVDFLTPEKETNFDFSGLAQVIIPKFIECKQFEEKHKRPIKISKNPIQAGKKLICCLFQLILIL
jgi:hypothetical protein